MASSADPLTFVRFCRQRGTNPGYRLGQQFPPLLVTAKQRGRLAIKPGPPVQIRAAKLNPLRVLRQTIRDMARQLKADRVLKPMIHATSL